MRKSKNGYYILEKFAAQSGLIHGFSTREFGGLKVRHSLNSNTNLDKFLQVLRIDKSNLIMMEQAHGSKIKRIREGDKGRLIKKVDGLITNQKGIFLGVNSADCLPLLFYDSKKKITGVAHAGWKGALARIAQKVVMEMKTMGSYLDDIIVGVGPHIGGCCYTIPKERARKFKKEFGNLPGMVYQDREGIHLDLAVPIEIQLIESGIKKKNIEFALTCTSCQNNEFFSYRRENKRKSYGEMLGVIGWT